MSCASGVTIHDRVHVIPTWLQWEAPPEPEVQTLEEPNQSRAMAELDTLGLIVG
jgi:hypothetical protein